MRGLEDGRDTLERRTLISGLATAIQSVRGVFTFLVARLLGQVAVGLLSVAWSWTDLLSKFGTWGLDQATTIHVAGHLARDRADDARRAHRHALTIGVLRSLAVAGLVAGGLVTSGSLLGWRPGGAEGLLILIWALPFVAAWRISNAASWGAGCLHHNIYSKGLTESGVTTAAFLGAYLLGIGVTAPLYAVICGYAAAGTVASLLARRRLGPPHSISGSSDRKNIDPPDPGGGDRRESPTEPAGMDRADPSSADPEDRPDVRDRLRETARAIGWNDLLYLFNLRMDVIVLSLFAGSALLDWLPTVSGGEWLSPGAGTDRAGIDLATIGAYGLAVEMAWGVRKLKSVFEPVYAPLLAGAAARGKLAREGAETLGVVLRWMLTVQLGLVGLLLVAGRLGLRLFGEFFPVAAPWLAILAFANLMNGFLLSEVAVNVLRPRLNILNGGVGTVVNGSLNLALIPVLGPLGAALATLTAFTVQSGMRVWQMQRLLDVSIPWRRLARPVAAFVAALPVGGGTILMLSPGPSGQAAAAAGFLLAYAAANLASRPADTVEELGQLWSRIRR